MPDSALHSDSSFESHRGLKLVGELRGHSGPICNLAWSPNGTFLASASLDKTARVWNVDTCRQEFLFDEHHAEVYGVAWSPNGQVVATSSADARLMSWRYDNPKQFRTLVNTESDGEGFVTDWAMSQPRTYAYTLGWSWSSRDILAAGYNDGTLRTLSGVTPWDNSPGEPLSRVQVSVVKRHQDAIYGLAWSQDGNRLVTCSQDNLLAIWDLDRIKEPGRQMSGHRRAVRCAAWSYDGRLLASGSDDDTIRIWEVHTGQTLAVLEGHTDSVVSLQFSPDNGLLVSHSHDGALRFWRTCDWTPVVSIETGTARSVASEGIAFAPNRARFAAKHGDDCIRVWDLEHQAMQATSPIDSMVHYTSAKVVLVGESNVGKSCLAMRLIENRYPNDDEHGTTHGMRVWTTEPPPSESLSTGAAYERRELVLWDMGGQPEYQLVHQLFLSNTALALVLFDPTRGNAAFAEVEQWNKRLEKPLLGQNTKKILVGTKLDSEDLPVNRVLIDRLISKCGFAAYCETSSLTGRGIDTVRTAIAATLDWGTLAVTTRTELFQSVLDIIEQQRRAGIVVLDTAELRKLIEQTASLRSNAKVLESAVKQLALQGRLSVVRRDSRSDLLVLQIAEIERCSGSIIRKARANPRGVPEIRESELMSLTDPTAWDLEALPVEQERIIIECCVLLLLERGICFRHEGLLIFPSLFLPTELEDLSQFSHAISLYYDFSGAIGNIYASLITSLALSATFGRVRLWENRAEFEYAGQGACGVRKSQESGGIAHLDVYFEDNTPAAVRDVFINFVENHLREHGVDILEHLEITCTCGFSFSESTIRSRLLQHERDIGCPSCDRRNTLSSSASDARRTEPTLDTKTWAIKTQVERRRREVVEALRSKLGEPRNPLPARDTIRILHLSDLHFDDSTQIAERFQPLQADLADATYGLDIEQLDYIVISGDLVQHADPREFEVARQFLSDLIEAFALSADRCIIVPGNHDLSWEEGVYDWKPSRHFPKGEPEKIAKSDFIRQGDGFLIRNGKKYPYRFRSFSETFYHPLMQLKYPLQPDEQCTVFTYPDTKLQFVAMNSAWEIDEFFPRRSGIHRNALSLGLAQADRARKQEIEQVSTTIRIGVCHHPITGSDAMEDVAFLDQLRKADVEILLHGHVHEQRADLVSYLDPRKIHVVGAGTFGAGPAWRPESIPRLYNLLEISGDRKSVKVHTRCLRREGGAWEGWAVWPASSAVERRTYYTIPLKSKTGHSQ